MASVSLKAEGVFRTTDSGKKLKSAFYSIPTNSSATDKASLTNLGVIKNTSSGTIGTIYYQSASTSDNTSSSDKSLLDNTGAIIKKANSGPVLSQIYIPALNINDIIDTTAFTTAEIDPNRNNDWNAPEGTLLNIKSVKGITSQYDNDNTELFTSGNSVKVPIVAIGKDSYGVYLAKYDYPYGEPADIDYSDVYYYIGQNKWLMIDCCSEFYPNDYSYNSLSTGIFAFEPDIPILKDESLIPSDYNGIFYATDECWGYVTPIPGVDY